mgnify:CR=1 FL=1
MKYQEMERGKVMTVRYSNSSFAKRKFDDIFSSLKDICEGICEVERVKPAKRDFMLVQYGNKTAKVICVKGNYSTYSFKLEVCVVGEPDMFWRSYRYYDYADINDMLTSVAYGLKGILCDLDIESILNIGHFNVYDKEEMKYCRKAGCLNIVPADPPIWNYDTYNTYKMNTFIRLFFVARYSDKNGEWTYSAECGEETLDFKGKDPDYIRTNAIGLLWAEKIKEMLGRK